MSTGAVRSILIPLTVSETWLSARSAQVPVAERSSPSSVTTCDVDGAGTPDKPSEHSQVAVTSPLFHPLELAGGVRLGTEICGAVRSMFTRTDALVWFPARSPIDW